MWRVEEKGGCSEAWPCWREERNCFADSTPWRSTEQVTLFFFFLFILPKWSILRLEGVALSEMDRINFFILDSLRLQKVPHESHQSGALHSIHYIIIQTVLFQKRQFGAMLPLARLAHDLNVFGQRKRERKGGKMNPSVDFFSAVLQFFIHSWRVLHCVPTHELCSLSVFSKHCTNGHSLSLLLSSVFSTLLKFLYIILNFLSLFHAWCW